MKRAYDDWMQVIEYDGKVLLNFKEKKKATASPKESLSGQANYPTSYDQQVYRQLPAITAVDQPTVDAGVLGGKMNVYFICSSALSIIGHRQQDHFHCG